MPRQIDNRWHSNPSRGGRSAAPPRLTLLFLRLSMCLGMTRLLFGVSLLIFWVLVPCYTIAQAGWMTVRGLIGSIHLRNSMETAPDSFGGR